MLRKPNLKLLALTSTVTVLSLASPVFAAPQIDISSPIENQKIESEEVTVSWKVSDFTVVDYAQYPKNKVGQGHVHLWLDENSPTAQNSIKVTSGENYTFKGIKSGSHTLIVELQNNDHSPLKPAIRKTINFETSAPIFVNPTLPQNDATLFLLLVSVILIGGLWYFLSPENQPITKPTHKSPSKKKK
jgi:hypothetical protein